MKRFCRYCGNELNDDASFCRKCGKKVSVESIGTQNTEKMRPPEAEETKFCRKCGKLISSTADFCKYCGCQMSASGAQAPDHLKENTFSGNRVVPLSGNVVNTGYNGNPNVYRQMPRKKSPKPVIAIVLVVAILFETLVKPGYLRTYLFYLQEEVVPEMNHTMFFHVKDETLEQAVNENELPTFDKSSYSRYSDEKTIQDYFNEHNIWFYFHNSETTDKEFIRGVQFIPANRTTKDYPIEIYQPAPSKDSDIVYTCTKYHYLQMGAPDGMMFKGDNTDLMPDIPVDFTIPKAE